MVAAMVVAHARRSLRLRALERACVAIDDERNPAMVETALELRIRCSCIHPSGLQGRLEMRATSCPDACGSELPTAAVPRAETPGRVLGYEARPGGSVSPAYRSC